MNRVFVADFETTVTGENKKQDKTEVWATALTELFDEESKVTITNDIGKFFIQLNMFNCDLTVYFHNLKFDGSFIIDYILRNGFTPSLDKETGLWNNKKFMDKKQFICTISDKGIWYQIIIRNKYGNYITIRDSLKLLPFSVNQIGKAFATKHKKLTMEYVGNMHKGCAITKEQKEYIRNDVLVVKEALEIMFKDGLNKMTIGACCKEQYKKSIMDVDFKSWFPTIIDMQLSENEYGSANADVYIRKSYKGGWCYVKKGCENQIFYNGSTADVNSLYPSMMLDNKYPVGKPIFWKGNIPDDVYKKNKLFFVRVKTAFKLKKGFLPTIQIKGSWRYKSNEWLETSEVRLDDGSYVLYRPTLTLTNIDWEMMQKHYDLIDCEILDGCWFWSLDGNILFSKYINKWAEIKKNSKGAKRTEAKLFLNNLYGKFSSKDDATTKLPYMGDDDKVHFKNIPDTNPDRVWFIPVGSFITSYARRFTITAAQNNYENFIYSDTDSIHCKCKGSEIKGIKIHPTDFSCWAIESEWDKGIFVRQKTYIEHVIAQDQQKIDNPFYDIKCAGMDKRPKELLAANLNNDNIELKNEYEKDFMNKKLDMTDFKIGIKVPSSLKPRRIKGGVLLISDYYTMRNK